MKSEKLLKTENLVMNSLPYDPYFHERRKTYQILNIGSDQVPRVIGDLSSCSSIKPEDLGPFGYLYAAKRDKWHISDQAIDFLYIGSNSLDFEIPGTLGIIQHHSVIESKSRHYPLYHFSDIDLIEMRIKLFLFAILRIMFLNKYANLKIVPLLFIQNRTTVYTGREDSLLN